ncbi:L-lysine 2,3-aminomutase [Rubripirellula obstinata]|uniref:L-lysine 2,3-aminomutase n=2 Tax=Rubripirellula obstinata TaxID=406547 RepID=A0A5B1CDD9_9BACT|nr:L-lysine 2,3-aminomutase [Rubripirellula obstinata]
MKRAIRDSGTLCEAVGLSDSNDSARKIGGENQFPTFVPLEFLGRLNPGDPADPLLRQVLPVTQEDENADPRFVTDPVGDQASMVASGLMHKYNGRTLMITTGACGVHCRYCFRREFPYSENRAHDWTPALEYIRANPTIDEVILSGGDPLTLVDTKLFDLFTHIESIDHVRRLRIHSRMPVVIPQRVTADLIDRLDQSRLAVWMVIHANHAAELDTLVLDRIDAMIRGGITVLNQAVLLRGINDNADALTELCEKLINAQVMPYYLHQLDRVRGAAHFEVPTQRGLELIEVLRQRLPGYAVPQYVTEQAGEPSKSPVGQVLSKSKVL